MVPRLVPLLLLGACITDLPTLGDPCAPFPEPGLFRVHIDRPDSRERDPYVYVPDGEGPRDLVVLLHGAGMNGPDIAESTGFVEYADEQGFVVVYPNALHWPVRYWNTGPQADQDGDNADDVAFLDAVVDVVSPKVCGDRVFATGFSSGSMMAQRWACEGEHVQAVGSSSGPLMVDSCKGGPTPIRYYHGTADTKVPEKGGQVDSPRGLLEYPSVADSMALWREANGCSDAEPTVDVDGDTTCTTWSCQAPTVQCIVEGWGHKWPGGIHSEQTDADATRVLWGFLDGSVPRSSTSAD